MILDFFSRYAFNIFVFWELISTSSAFSIFSLRKSYNFFLSIISSIEIIAISSWSPKDSILWGYFRICLFIFLSGLFLSLLLVRHFCLLLLVLSGLLLLLLVLSGLLLLLLVLSGFLLLLVLSGFLLLLVLSGFLLLLLVLSGFLFLLALSGFLFLLALSGFLFLLEYFHLYKINFLIDYSNLLLKFFYPSFSF